MFVELKTPWGAKVVVSESSVEDLLKLGFSKVAKRGRPRKKTEEAK